MIRTGWTIVWVGLTLFFVVAFALAIELLEGVE